MALSHNPSIGRQEVLLVVRYVPLYIPMSVQPYAPIVITPTRGTIKVLKKHNAILENLGTELNTGQQQGDICGAEYATLIEGIEG